jgi:hypothetical protein
VGRKATPLPDLVMEILDFVRDYGWLGALILYFGPKVWNFLTDRIYPQRVAERTGALQAERERQALLLKSQIEREDREFDHRKEIDNRIVASIEGTNVAIQQMGLAITVGNERITQLISAHSRHDNFTLGAHVELKEKMEQLEEMIDSRNQIAELRRQLTETQEKIKFTGKDKKGAQPE